MLTDKYTNQIQIASGGMGVLYKAGEPLANNRDVALKRIHPHLTEHPAFVERFLREASTMAQLSHPHIVTLYTVEKDKGTYVLVMEFCHGGTLETMIKKQSPLPVYEVVRLTAQLASALSHAHSQPKPIVHRDIKPANVLFDKQRNVKLTDFGIAAVLREAKITKPQEVIGTVAYMSPEQANGLELDGRSDLFSLGIMMYEMLTGRTPYGESSDTAIYKKLVHDQEELHLQFPDHVPPLVQDVVQHLLRRHREDRMPNADLLSRQLEDILFTLQPKSTASGQRDSRETRLVTPEPATNGSAAKTVFHPLPPPPEPVPTPSPFPNGTASGDSDDRPSIRPYVTAILVALFAALSVWVVYSLVSSGTSPDQKEAKGTITELETTLSNHGKEVQTLLIQFEKDRYTSNCQAIKNALTTAYGKYSDMLVQVNRLRPEPIASITRPIHLDHECLDRTPPPDDPELVALLNKFKQAYEHREKNALRSMSVMSPERQRNIETMFGNYQSFKLAIGTPYLEPNGTAIIEITIETAILPSGKPWELPDTAKHFTLLIPRLGNSWDKIHWD